MTLQTRIKVLRKHLLDNWDYADEWINSEKASNGAYCLLSFTLKDENKPLVGLIFSLDPNVFRGVLSMLRENGKEAVLAYLDTLILGGVTTA